MRQFKVIVEKHSDGYEDAVSTATDARAITSSSSTILCPGCHFIRSW